VFLPKRKEFGSVDRPEPLTCDSGLRKCEVRLRLLSEAVCLLVSAGLETHEVTRELVSVIREVSNVGLTKVGRGADLDR
jgi:hypothetical protein